MIPASRQKRITARSGLPGAGFFMGAAFFFAVFLRRFFRSAYPVGFAFPAFHLAFLLFLLSVFRLSFFVGCMAAAFPVLTFPACIPAGLYPVKAAGGPVFPASRRDRIFSGDGKSGKKRNVFFSLYNSAQKKEWKKIFSRVRFLLH